MRDLRYGDLLRPRDSYFDRVVFMYLARHPPGAALLLVRGMSTLKIVSYSASEGDVVLMPDDYMGDFELIAP